MKHYLFEAAEAGQFLVGAECYSQAEYIARSEFPNQELEFLDTLSEWEAENSGLDEF